MQTIIHSNDFSVTGALDTFIKQQARKSMSACSSRVDRLVIRLKDINGPKGGPDKECSVEVKLANHAPIVVSKRSSDAYASIRQALGRASRTTLRKLGKRRSAKHDPRAFSKPEIASQSEFEDKTPELLAEFAYELDGTLKGDELQNELV